MFKFESGWEVRTLESEEEGKSEVENGGAPFVLVRRGSIEGGPH
jgi:hypothetical protein